MDVHLTCRTRLRVTSNDVLDHNGPREDLRGLVHLMERVQHRLATRPTGHVVQVQLGHPLKRLGIEPVEDLVRQQGMHPPGREEVIIVRVDNVPDGTELVDQLISHERKCVRHFHPHPAVKPPRG